MAGSVIRTLAQALRRPEPPQPSTLDDAAGATPTRSPAAQRLRHVLVAGLIALVLGFWTILSPVDQIIWTAQARMVTKQPSGTIAFIGLEPEFASASSGHGRRYLAHVLDKLRTAGPAMVMLDIDLETRTDAASDLALRKAMQAYGSRIVLVRRRVDELNGERIYRPVSDVFTDAAQQAPHWRYINYMGFAWESDTRLDMGNGLQPSAAYLLAGTNQVTPAEFDIDYRYDTLGFHAARSASLSSNNVGAFKNRNVVIGVDASVLDSTANIPGRLQMPASYVLILAAETIKGGFPIHIPLLVPIAIMTLLLGMASRTSRNSSRYVSYVALIGLFGTSIYLCSVFNIRTSFAPAVALLAAFTTTRIWWHARNRGILYDDRTGLPTFRALERELNAQKTQTSSFIVARVHNFDDVLSALPDTSHTAYVKLLSDRLRVADEDRQLYYGGNGYFAWTMPAMGRERLTDHLLGIRLLCYDPVKLDEDAIDITVSFGVDGSADNSAARKLAAARNAASQSNQADRPVVFAQHTADEEHLWQLSIQHKIDAAIETGEIYPVFQPQFCTATGRVAGVEALVRWRDPVRGAVPTDWFIDQCEKAGRMDRLTRLMLLESMRQLHIVDSAGKLRLSVNISATTLQDMRLYELVRGALVATRFDGHRLTLELTETWRIGRPETAAEVMERVATLGVRWALDDFGARTATYDALMMYPIAEIKIDRSLTSKVVDLRKGRRIVRSICQMGADMDLDVVAEGIESDAELETLRDFGCPLVQGFALSPPLPLEELRTLLSSVGTAEGRTG